MKDSSDEFIKGYENYILSEVTKVSEKLQTLIIAKLSMVLWTLLQPITIIQQK